MLEAQNKRIDDLMGRIRLQQEKLDKQNVRIRTLQSQVGLRCIAYRIQSDLELLVILKCVYFPKQTSLLGIHQIKQRQRPSALQSSSPDGFVQGGVAEQHDSPVGE